MILGEAMRAVLSLIPAREKVARMRREESVNMKLSGSEC